MPEQRVAAAADIPQGGGREFDVGGRAIAIWNVGGAFFATAARCPHEDGPLCAGAVEAGVVTCPMHGWRFDVTTGRGVEPPDRCLRTYPLRVEGGNVFVVL